MSGNVNEPDSNSRHTAPESDSADTAGEFTRIFAAGAIPEPYAARIEPVDPQSSDDEFDRMFTSGTSSAAPPAESSKPTASSDAIRPIASSDATLIFEALPPIAENAARGPFAEPSAARGVLPTVSPAQPTQYPLHAEPEQAPAHASDFTQVFSQVAPPSSPPPRTETPQITSAPPSGEFTQFFSAISARESVSRLPQAHNPLSPSGTDSRGGAARPPVQDPKGELFNFSTSQLPQTRTDTALTTGAAAGSSSSGGTAAPYAVDSTQVFRQEAVASAPAALPKPVATARPVASAGDSFTQVFQQIAPPSHAGPAPQSATALTQPFLPPATASSTAPQEAWPAFGPPPQPGGSFTDVFAAQPQASSRPFGPPQPPAVPAQGAGGFTELFQAKPVSQPHADSSPFGAFDMPAHAGASPWLSTPSSPEGTQPLPNGGEFTRLMQSLTPGAQGNATASPANNEFFASTPGSAQHESEYTRVQRASSMREAGSLVSPVAPPAAALTPGLVAAPAAEKSAGKEAPAKKSRLLVILLVAMNVLLLVALIVVGFIVLRRK